MLFWDTYLEEKGLGNLNMNIILFCRLCFAVLKKAYLGGIQRSATDRKYIIPA